MPMNLNLGDIVELKKQHACGCKQFEIIRVGMDIKIKCTNCKRLIMLDRPTLEKRVKKIINNKSIIFIKHIISNRACSCKYIKK